MVGCQVTLQGVGVQWILQEVRTKKIQTQFDHHFLKCVLQDSGLRGPHCCSTRIIYEVFWQAEMCCNMLMEGQYAGHEAGDDRRRVWDGEL